MRFAQIVCVATIAAADPAAQSRAQRVITVKDLVKDEEFGPLGATPIYMCVMRAGVRCGGSRRRPWAIAWVRARRRWLRRRGASDSALLYIELYIDI